MRLLVGTKGYGYSEWKGLFYPEDLNDAHMLGYYALRFRTVEINRTVHGMPEPETLRHWSAATPHDFVFAVRAPRGLGREGGAGRTRDAADGDAPDDPVEPLRTELDAKLGPLLLSCPGGLKTDAAQLDALLQSMPPGTPTVVEFRSNGSCEDEVVATLRRHHAALCISDGGDSGAQPTLVATAPFGYVRLSAPSYSDDALEAWAERIAAQPWETAFIIFAPEERRAAPKLALRMLEFAEAATPLIRPLARSAPPPPVAETRPGPAAAGRGKPAGRPAKAGRRRTRRRARQRRS